MTATDPKQTVLNSMSMLPRSGYLQALLVFALLCFPAAGCGSTSDTSMPSASDGKDVFVNMIDEKYGEGIASVIAFQELKRETVNYGVIIAVVLEYEAVVEFPEGVRIAFEHKSDDDRFSFRASGLPKVVDQQKAVLSGKGWITFVLSEKGWHASDGNIYSSMTR